MVVAMGLAVPPVARAVRVVARAVELVAAVQKVVGGEPVAAQVRGSR